jgi:hypothetical protein
MHSTKIAGKRPALIREVTSMITLNSRVPKFPTNLILNGRGRSRRWIVALITINNYMTFLITDLTSRNVNARTKNARIKSKLNLIRSWTTLVMITTSATTLKMRTSIAKVTTSGTMETTIMTIKSPIEARGKLRW